MREILRLFKRFFVRLRFWKKHKKPVESTLTTQLKTFYDAELLGNAQAYSNWFAEGCQVGVKPNGSLIHWNIFKPLIPKQGVCCGEIIPEGYSFAVCEKPEEKAPAIPVDTVRNYLLRLIEEWNELGARKYDLPNIQVYNHIRKELDDLESYIGNIPNRDCK